MEKYPLKGNNKSIALQSLVGGSNKHIIGSNDSSSSSTGGVTYQSVSKKVIFYALHYHFIHNITSYVVCVYREYIVHNMNKLRIANDDLSKEEEVTETN